MPVYPGRRRGTYRVTVFAHSEQHEWIVEGTRRDATGFEARKLIELRAQRVAPSRAATTFSRFCLEDYAPHAVRHLGGDTWNKVRRYQVATLARLLGHIRIDALSTEDIEMYKDARRLEATKRGARRGSPMKVSSINNELRVLKTMLSWGRSEKKPIGEVRIKMLTGAGKPRVRAWTLDEVRRVYVAAGKLYPELLAMLVFLVNTGCRKGEARAAEWSWVDWAGKMLRIPVTEFWQPKDKEAREVPLSDSLLAMLKSRPRGDVPWIFPNSLDRRYETFPEESYRIVTRSAKVAGGPHTTRHTFASHFLKARPDLPLLAQVLGHSTTRVTELYAHMLPGHLDRARNAVDLAPPSKLWRPTLAKVKEPPFFPKKTQKRH